MKYTKIKFPSLALFLAGLHQGVQFIARTDNASFRYARTATCPAHTATTGARARTGAGIRQRRQQRGQWQWGL